MGVRNHNQGIAYGHQTLPAWKINCRLYLCTGRQIAYVEERETDREGERAGRDDSASVTVVCWCIYINCYINGEGKAMHMVNA